MPRPSILSTSLSHLHAGARALAGFAGLAALLSVAACGSSELVREFEGIAADQCACGDADCAKQVHARFNAAWADMKRADIDWSSDQGKKDTKGIEEATKKYRGCLDEHTSAKAATELCQADEKATSGTEACTACCEAEGRFFHSWVDPMAAGLAGAFGAGDVKGCACK